MEALSVALKLQILVPLQGILAARKIDLHRMIDNEVDGADGIDLFRVAAESGNGVAHCCKIDDGGDSGEVLEKASKNAVCIVLIEQSKFWSITSEYQNIFGQKMCRNKGAFAGIKENALTQKFSDFFQKSAGIRGILPG